MRIFRYVIFFLIIIGLLVLAFVLISRAISSLGGNNDDRSQVEMISLADLADTDATVTLLADGPVSADEVHNSVRIIVSRDQNRMEVVEGYENKVVKQQSFASNPNAFEEFLKALEKAGFAAPISTAVPEDHRGYCPLGTRYVYTIDEGSDEKMRAWQTSCNIGNYKGVRGLTNTLFKQQIPQESYRELVQGARLYL